VDELQLNGDQRRAVGHQETVSPPELPWLGYLKEYQPILYRIATEGKRPANRVDLGLLHQWKSVGTLRFVKSTKPLSISKPDQQRLLPASTAKAGCHFCPDFRICETQLQAHS
jgi:hypothetical protein